MDPVPPEGPPDWVEQIAQLAKILSWVSCTTVLLPIATFLLFPSKRAFPARLPVHMCIAILGVCLTALFGLYFPVSFCPYQAIGIQFFGNAGILWWLIISFNFFQVFVLDRTEYRFEKPFLFIGWGIPLIVTIIAKATDQLDNSPMPYQWECWIGEFGGYAQWVYLYAFMGSSCLFGLFMWVRIIHRIWFTHVAPSSGQDRPLVLLGYVRHLIFLCAFLFVFSCLFAYRIANDILRGQTGFSLTLLHTICVCGTGVYCFVVFGLTSQNLDLWWSALRNVFYPGASKSEKYASGGSSAYGTFSTTPLASPSELDASEGSTVYKFSQGDGNPLEAPLLVTAGNASFTSDSNPLSDSDDDVYNPFAPTASSGQSQDRL